jgi:hypothetical protein
MFGMNISVADLGGGYRLGSGEGLFKIDGIAELIRKFNAMKVNTKRIVMAGLREEMEGILQLAVDKYVPIDSGQLRDSKHMRGSFEGDTVMVEGGFGPVFNERGSGYAVPVHEIPEPPSKSPSISQQKRRTVMRFVTSMMGGCATTSFFLSLKTTR